MPTKITVASPSVCKCNCPATMTYKRVLPWVDIFEEIRRISRSNCVSLICGTWRMMEIIHRKYETVRFYQKYRGISFALFRGKRVSMRISRTLSRFHRRLFCCFSQKRPQIRSRGIFGVSNLRFTIEWLKRAFMIHKHETFCPRDTIVYFPAC